MRFITELTNKYLFDRKYKKRIKKKRLPSIREDEFITWVRFGVPGMLEPRNILAMEIAIKNMPEGNSILEIGSFCGLSTVVLSHLLRKHHNRAAFFTCDKWQFEGQQLGSFLGSSAHVTHDDYRAYVKETFIRSMKTFADDRLPNTIECLSDEFFHRWSQKETAVDVFGRSVTLGGNVSFCYIDGNHTYDFAKRDFENTDRIMVPGGFILFDDSADGSTFEVNRLAREIASGAGYDVVSSDPNYLFRKK